MTACTIDGCDRPLLARGWCRVHYARWRRCGDPRPEVPITRRARPDPETVSYRAALQRVRARRGAASGQACACGSPAVSWLYDGADTAEHRDAGGRRYSLDPAHYRPCCRFCHRRAVVDRRAELPRGVVTPAFDVERAVRLYRAGAASTGIAALLRVSPAAVVTALRAHGLDIRARGRQPIDQLHKNRGESRPLHRDPTAGAAAPEGDRPC